MMTIIQTIQRLLELAELTDPDTEIVAWNVGTKAVARLDRLELINIDIGLIQEKQVAVIQIQNT
jgi:hypothetical protein